MAASSTLKWTILGSALFVVGGGLIAGYVGCQRFMGTAGMTPEALQREIDGARREGLPLEFDEIIPPLPDPKRNAAIAYREVSERMVKKPMGELRRALYALYLPGVEPGQIRIAQEGLRKYAKELEQVGAASRLPECVFDRDWSLGANLPFPELAQLKSCGQMLAARALLSAREGRFGDSERDLRATFAMATHVGSEPTLISGLVQTAIEAFALRAISTIVLRNPNDVRATAMADRLLDTYPKGASLMNALKGEIAFGQIVIKTLKDLREIEALSAGEERSATPNPLNNIITPELRRTWQIRNLQFWRRAFQKIRESDGDPIVAGKILDEEVEKEDAQKDMGHLMNRILFPVFGQAGIAFANTHAHAEVVRATSALMKYRKRHGRFPNELSEVGKFVDKMDGKPLRYQRTASGFKVWSIGHDLDDNRGAPKGVEGRKGMDTVVVYPQ